jgi:hypothetical protein
MPRQFAPIDRRLVYDSHICRMSHQQIILYLFLHVVSDVRGLSYYSDERIGQYLHLSLEQLRQARRGLLHTQYILYHRPIYQILDLPASAEAGPLRRKADSIPRTPRRNADAGTEAVPIQHVLSRLCARGFVRDKA